jgi:hypothetical protein
MRPLADGPDGVAVAEAGMATYHLSVCRAPNSQT